MFVAACNNLCMGLTYIELIQCRAMGDVSDRIGRPTDNGQVKILLSCHMFVCDLHICVFGVAAKLGLYFIQGGSR